MQDLMSLHIDTEIQCDTINFFISFILAYFREFWNFLKFALFKSISAGTVWSIAYLSQK